VIAFGPAGQLPFWQNPDWGDLPLEPPFLTFTDEIALHAGDTRITVKHVGTAAHTTNDVVAWFPGQSVLFCGDLEFNGGTPFLLMGSVAGSVEVLEQVVLPLGARTIVPGHGPVFEGTAPVEATLDYLRFVLDLAARPRGERVAPGSGARDRPWPVRRLAGRGTHRRKPVPRLRGTRRNPARRPGRRPGGAGRHGRLQRRQAADLPGLILARSCWSSLAWHTKQSFI
jgi:glyoxylase-like metal-dependent hydrolase (beta-lactamase superfamily II)